MATPELLTLAFPVTAGPSIRIVLVASWNFVTFTRMLPPAANDAVSGVRILVGTVDSLHATTAVSIPAVSSSVVILARPGRARRL
jgi:hypothetical protein